MRGQRGEEEEEEDVLRTVSRLIFLRAERSAEERQAVLRLCVLRRTLQPVERQPD